MPIPTDSYAIILERYQAAIKWMESLGVELRPGRTSHYEKVIRYWTQAYRTATPAEAQRIFPDFVSSMFEIYDFINIYLALKDVPPHQLTSVADKLKNGVNGPINAADETPESTKDRNFLFEAVVSAKSHRPSSGVETIFDAPSDTGILIRQKKNLGRMQTCNKCWRNRKQRSQGISPVRTDFGKGNWIWSSGRGSPRYI